ncbi:hypothetical protein [Swingsia samuiensis]|nr:hypothetical protein [Swingsia samuiensis]
MKYGVPWDIIRSWSRPRRVAACVITAEREGHKFDWDLMRYEE